MKNSRSRIIPLALSLALSSGTMFAGNWQNEKVLPADSKKGRPAEVLDHTVLVRFKAGTFAGATKTDAMLRNLSSLVRGAEVQELLFRPEQSILREAADSKGNRLLSAAEIGAVRQAEEPLLRTAIMRYEENISPEEYCRKLMRENRNVEYAEPYYLPELLSGKFIPNDTFIDSQNNLKQIKAFEAWDIYQGDSNVVIAISDGGVDQDHEDLAPNIWTNTGEIPDNGIDDDGNGYTDDYRGCNLAAFMDDRSGGDTRNVGEAGSHGTIVSGLAGAAFNNAKGVAGTGGKSRIFPIKIAPYGSRRLFFDYQSIIYAARMQFKVMNCSWGAPAPFSPIYQSVINYAISRDVAIVFAGGNEENMTKTVFPAGYSGTLGVGELRTSGQLSSVSSLGPQIHIMAPAENGQSTMNNGGYTTPSGGTSFAAPVVSGVVAMIRGKYPQLSPVQALEFARQSTDFVADLTPQYEKFIPGRINMLKAMTNSPFSTPSIRPLSFETYSTGGTRTNRFVPGDTAVVRIAAKNHLGAGKDLVFTLSTTSSAGEVQIIKSDAVAGQIAAGEQFTISEFRIRVQQEQRTPVLLRVDIEGQGQEGNEYKDFFLTEFTPTIGMTTLSNETMAFSVGDAGSFAREAYPNKLRPGLGFSYKLVGDFVYKGGFFATRSETVSPSALDEEGYSVSDFTPKKYFSAPDEHIGIMSDENAGTDRIGLEIKQEYYFLSPVSSVAKAIVSMKNVSGQVLNNIAGGYYLDWDVGFSGTDDVISLFPEAVPGGMQGEASAAYIIRSESTPQPVIGGAVVSSEQGAAAQFTGFENSRFFSDSYTAQDRYELINQGVRVLDEHPTDGGIAVGMKFNGAWQPDETRRFTVYFGAAETREALKNVLLKAMDSTVSAVEENFSREELSLMPNPANERMSAGIPVRTGERYELRVISPLGEEVFFVSGISSETGYLALPVATAGFAPGMYIAEAKAGGKILTRKFMIVR